MEAHRRQSVVRESTTMPHWAVPRGEWKGETAFLLAGGESLKAFDADVLTGRPVIAINNAWELRPDAHILYAGDAKWWTTQSGQEAIDHFEGCRMITLAKTPPAAWIMLLQRSVKERGLSDDPTELVGSHSGYQAVNLAYLLGAARIVLVGYDMRGQHFHAGHPGQDPDVFTHHLKTRFLPSMKHLIEPLARAGVEICTARPSPGVPHSAIDWWPQRELGDLL